MDEYYILLMMQLFTSMNVGHSDTYHSSVMIFAFLYSIEVHLYFSALKHFNSVGKVRFGGAMLSCNSSYWE